MSSLFWMFVLCGVCSAKEMWFLCTVSHECNTPHVNTDIDMVVCILIAFFLPVRFTDHYPVSNLGKKAYDDEA